MNRLLLVAAAAVLAVLVLRHPAGPPAAIAVITPSPVSPRSSQASRKGHPPALAEAVVYVAGAVARPGLYRVAAGARVNDAVLRAGGLTRDADPTAVNLAERVSDGEEIDVLRIGQAAPASRGRAAGRSAHPRKRRRKRAAFAPVDLNRADAQTLAALPGIGPTLAARIVEYRRVNGPFASVDELADVAGLTTRRVDAITPYLRV